MNRCNLWRMIIPGASAGIIAGLFGAGGGLILVPLLAMMAPLKERELFPASVSIMLPVCIVSLISTAATVGVDWINALPYLLGSAAGGFLAGKYGSKLPTKWLHRILGLLILWGGFRYLC